MDMSTEATKKDELLHLASFQRGERGNRIEPKKSHRTHWHLTLLRQKLERIIASELLPAGETLLDYGCADKPYQRLFKPKFERYLGADIAGNPAADLIIDGEGHIPVEDGTIDCVLSSQVLEHVPDPAAYLKEAKRVIRTGGTLILSTHGIWPYHPDPTDFWRWTIDGLQVQIRQAGFEILHIQGVFGLESSALQLWQDATFERLPRVLQPFYTRVCQFIIGLIERRHPDKLSNDASVYVVLAKKG